MDRVELASILTLTRRWYTTPFLGSETGGILKHVVLEEPCLVGPSVDLYLCGW